MDGLQQLIALPGRIFIALVFLWIGYGKVTDFAGNVGYAAAAGMPLPEVGIAAAIVIELLGSLLLIIGYRTRLIALIMAAFALATALIFHRDFSNYDQEVNFMKNLSIMGGLLQIVAFGGGRYSLDARRS